MTDDSRPSENERLDTATAEATALRQAVESLADAIMSAAPKEEKRYKNLALLALIGGPLLFVLTMAFAIVTTNNGNHRSGLIRDGIACLLADVDDHRHTTQSTQQKIAEKLGLDIPAQPADVPLSQTQVEELEKLCTRFVGDATGLRSQRGDRAHP